MNDIKKTLVILTPGFPSSEADTTCLPMQQHFVRSINEIYPQYNIIILSLQYPYFKKTYSWFNNRVMTFSGRNKGGLRRLLLRRKLYRVLKDINSNSGITGLLSFWCGECALVGKRFGDKYQIPHRCWIFGQDARKNNKYPALIHPSEDELVALSDFLQEEFARNHGIRPRHVVSPGMDIISEVSQKRDIDILAVGSLIPLKQYEIFLDIVAGIKKKYVNVKAVLVGDGPQRSFLQQRITQLNLQENVTLTRELPYPNVLELMQRTKAFLHPSSYEGFSGTCLEALQNGARVISFCKPMKQDIENWQIAESRKEMEQLALDVLENGNLEYKSIIPFSIKDTVEKISILIQK